MLKKIKEIASSWIISIKPTDNQKILAQKRYDVCLSCEFYGEKREITKDEYCKQCGCPISKKIFSPLYNECPEKKWEHVDSIYWKSTQKNKKSVI